jgi:hypothetical protein
MGNNMENAQTYISLRTSSENTIVNGMNYHCVMQIELCTNEDLRMYGCRAQGY